MKTHKSDNQRKLRTIYYLIDTGKQMAGDKIGSVNSAMEEAVTVDLPDITAICEDDIQVAIMQFSNGASWITPSSGPVPIGEAIWNDLHAFGANDFGQALMLLERALQNFNVDTHNAPIIIAFSNAPVTDDYRQALNHLNRIDCFRRSLKIGIAIGQDADRNALKLFAGNNETVITVNDKCSLKRLITRHIEYTRGNSLIDLGTILKQHPDCLNSRASFKSILMDKYPSEKRMVNILTILFECGIANKIKAKKSIDSNEMQRLIAQVENDYGISAQYAQNAILVWAATFGITASTVKMQDVAASSSETKTPVDNVSPEYVEGAVNDYDIVEKMTDTTLHTSMGLKKKK